MFYKCCVVLVCIFTCYFIIGNYRITTAVTLSETSLGPAPVVKQHPVSGSIPAGMVTRGSSAFALQVTPEKNLVHFNDIHVSNNWTIISGVSYRLFAGDFMNNDFTTMYTLDYDNNKLVVVNMSTGQTTIRGSSVPSGSQVWTGLAGTSNGILYASATDLSASNLYRINPTTGAVTNIGTITNAPGIIDIAISPGGTIYGVDIVLESLVRINSSTGAGTIIGSLGFDANYAQDMDFDDSTGVLYLAAYNNDEGRGELRTANVSTGATTLIGVFPEGAEVDCFGIVATASPGSRTPTRTSTPPTGPATRTPTRTSTPPTGPASRTPTKTNTPVTRTPTRTPTRNVTRTPTRTPTAPPQHSLDLYYTSHSSYDCFSAGEYLDARYTISHYASDSTTVDLYLVIEYDGHYYFWPSWGESMDYQRIIVYPYQSRDQSFISCTWPSNVGSIDNVTIYGAAMIPYTYNLISNLDSIPFCALGSGTLSFTLTWTYYGGGEGPDIDLHVITPYGDHIYWQDRFSSDGGELDFDDRGACAEGDGGGPENIFWDAGAPSGTYEYYVDWYNPCGDYWSVDFSVSIRENGNLMTTTYGQLSGGDSGSYYYYY